MMNSEANGGMGRGTIRGGGNSRGGFNRNQNDVQRITSNFRRQN